MIMFMLKSFHHRAGRAAILLALTAAVTPAAAQAPVYAESPEDSLSRNVRLLAQNPRNFAALIAAGRAALATGDTQTAIGFFGRAQEVSPNSWQPQAGMGAAMVAMGNPSGSMAYFSRAQQLGAAHILIAVDRGLAFDLIGDQAKAQSDYRAALNGADADEARRRLALSLAISRDIKGAAAAIEPLLRRRDPEAVRINAFVLALAGDREGARRTIDAAMPGAGSRFEPFFKVLPVLRPAEKAAAVHLGEFPKDAAQRYAQAEPISSSPVLSIGNSSPPRTVTVPRSPPRAAVQKPAKVAEAPRRAVRQAPVPSTYMAMVRPSLDPSRYASTRRPKTQSGTPTKPQAASDEPEPRPGRLDDIARMLDTPAGESQVLTRVAETNIPATSEPIAEIVPTDIPPAPTQRFEIDLPPEPVKPAANSKASSNKRAAEAKKRAETLAAEKKAKAQAAKLGVTGTNWVQLAGGSNQDRMSAEYRKLSAKAGSLLRSRSGYVTEGKDYFRLLVGPFPSRTEAQAFVNKLEKAGVDGFSWTRTPAQIKIEKLKT
jgi:Flp pilus assembly protein TadD